MKVFIRKCFLFCSICILVLCVTSCAYRARPINDISHDVPANLELNQVREGIYNGIVKSKCNVSESEKGLRATCPPRNNLTIEIQYNTKKYTVSFIEANGFNYDRDNQTIHTKYYRKVRNITDAINGELKRLALEL